MCRRSEKGPQETFFSNSSVRKTQLLLSMEMTDSSVFIIQLGWSWFLARGVPEVSALVEVSKGILFLL